MLEYLLAHTNHVMDLLVLLLLVGAWCAPLFGNGVLGAIERWGTRVAERKSLAIMSIGTAAVLIRLSLLWILPVPVPMVHDEFSYLLAADTFAHGRLANPPHSMWMYFDTFHVNQLPTYMSKYPPGQGAALALGELFGHPWIGVVLSVAVMCAAVVWMLQGWLPPRWALLGGILLLLRLGVFNYWMNSYWGGAVAAIGGALVVGALPRIFHFTRPRDAVLLGLGVAILANSRPFEGLVFCLPVAGALVIWLCGRHSPPWRTTFRRIILPLTAVVLLCGTFMAYYNWRGTGNAFLFPYTLNDRTYSSTPSFIFQKPAAPRHYLNPQFDRFYNEVSRSLWATGRPQSIHGAARILWRDGRIFLGAFMMPELCIPLVALPWLLTDRRPRFLVVQFVFCVAGFLIVAWFFPHYAAPLTATTFAILTQGLRHLRRWQYRGRSVGIALSRVVVLAAVVLAPFHPSAVRGEPSVANRARIAAQLNTIPGNHLVVVRYSRVHIVGAEWVYNAADIDHSKTVWAREIPDVSLQPLFDYFPKRDVWVVEPDSENPQLSPYRQLPKK